MQKQSYYNYVYQSYFIRGSFSDDCEAALQPFDGKCECIYGHESEHKDCFLALC
jgi:hypothetical protein